MAEPSARASKHALRTSRSKELIRNHIGEQLSAARTRSLRSFGNSHQSRHTVFQFRTYTLPVGDHAKHYNPNQSRRPYQTRHAGPTRDNLETQRVIRQEKRTFLSITRQVGPVRSIAVPELPPVRLRPRRQHLLCPIRLN